ncbi:protein Churchill isoform X3 [Pogona vitticeps]
MCRDCVKTEYPSRGNICLENGSYLMNYAGCVECKKKDFVMITNRATDEEDGEEIITYDRWIPRFTGTENGSHMEDLHWTSRYSARWNALNGFQCISMGFFNLV